MTEFTILKDIETYLKRFGKIEAFTIGTTKIGKTADMAGDHSKGCVFVRHVRNLPDRNTRDNFANTYMKGHIFMLDFFTNDVDGEKFFYDKKEGLLSSMRGYLYRGNPAIIVDEERIPFSLEENSQNNFQILIQINVYYPYIDTEPAI